MFRLARTLHYTVQDLLDHLGEDELDLWVAFDQIEPLPDSWLETGTIASTVFNMLRSSETAPQRPIDFIPHSHKPRERQHVSLMQAHLNMVVPKT